MVVAVMGAEEEEAVVVEAEVVEAEVEGRGRGTCTISRQPISRTRVVITSGTTLPLWIAIAPADPQPMASSLTWTATPLDKVEDMGLV